MSFILRSIIDGKLRDVNTGSTYQVITDRESLDEIIKQSAELKGIDLVVILENESVHAFATTEDNFGGVYIMNENGKTIENLGVKGKLEDYKSIQKCTKGFKSISDLASKTSRIFGDFSKAIDLNGHITKYIAEATRGDETLSPVCIQLRNNCWIVGIQSNGWDIVACRLFSLSEPVITSDKVNHNVSINLECEDLDLVLNEIVTSQDVQDFNPDNIKRK